MSSNLTLPLPPRPAFSISHFVKLATELKSTPLTPSGWWLAKFSLAILGTVLQLLFGLIFPNQPYLVFGAIALLVQILVGLPLYAHVFTHLKSEKGKVSACFGGLASFIYATVLLLQNSPNLSIVGGTLFITSHLALAGLALILFLESQMASRIHYHLQHFMRTRVNKTHVITGDRTETVATESLKIGQTFIVRAGEKIPRDGTVLNGTTSVDESIFTSEDKPLLKGKGDTVIGGSLNRDSEIHVQVTQDRQADVLEQLIRKTENALNGSSHFSTQASLITNLCLITTIVIALLAAFFTHNIVLATGVLFASPLSLVLLTRFTMDGFISHALSQGIIFSSRSAVETIAGVHSLFFNKTGTLSLNDFTYSQTFIENGTNLGMFLSVLFSLEKSSNHPLALAMETHPWYIEVAKHPVRDFQAQPGLGVSAMLQQRGGQEFFVAAGNLRFMKRQRFYLSRDMKAKIDDLEEMGETVVLCGYDRSVHGVMSFSDTIRRGVRSTLRRLQKLGIETALITGDTEKTVTQLTGTLGIKKIFSRCTPEEKAAKIAKEKEEGRIVAIVDSDIDDNPALQAAHVSLSIDTGTDINQHPADILILGSHFKTLYWLMSNAKSYARAIKAFVALGLVLNALLIAGSFLGWFTPISLLLLSTLTTILALKTTSSIANQV